MSYYMERMTALQLERFRKLSKIWFSQGLEAFQTALENSKLPNWNDYFDKLWIEFTTVKLKCLECGTIKVFKLDFDETIDIEEYLKGYISLHCFYCGFIDMDKWERIKK